MLNKHCSHYSKLEFLYFLEAEALVLWQKIVPNLFIFVYLFCSKNSTIDSRKTAITQEWLVVESCPPPCWVAIWVTLICSNVYNDAKVFEVWRFIKNTKKKHLENETFFLQIKKISHYTGYYIDKNVLAEVTFKSFLMWLICL